MGRDVHSFTLSIQHFLRRPRRLDPTLQGVLKDGLGEVVVACDMPEPCKFPSLENCQKRFPRTHKEVDLTPHPVIDLVLQVGDAENLLAVPARRKKKERKKNRLSIQRRAHTGDGSLISPPNVQLVGAGVQPVGCPFAFCKHCSFHNIKPCLSCLFFFQIQGSYL